MSGKARVLSFLQDYPAQWHYGRDIAIEANVSRGTIYIILGVLEEEGKVQRRLETVAHPDGRLPRPQYRITRAGLLATPPIGGEAFA